MKKVNVLEELERLKNIHKSSKIDSTKFQPKEDEQKKLIIHNIANRVVALSIKREGTKYIYKTKVKLEEDLRRKLNNQGDDDSSVMSGGSGSTTLTPDRKGRARTTPGGKSPNKKAHRHKKALQNSANISGNTTMVNFSFTERYFSYSSMPRAQTTGGSSRLQAYSQTLSKNTSSDDIISTLNQQAEEQTKDAKKIFESLVKSFDGGKVCQMVPKRHIEEIDVSAFTSTISMANVKNLEDLNQMRKKDGMLLFFDPSTNTEQQQITIKVNYMKSIDIANEVEVTKEFHFWSDGNYFGLTLTKDLVRPSTNPHTNSSVFSSSLDSDRAPPPMLGNLGRGMSMSSYSSGGSLAGGGGFLSGTSKFDSDSVGSAPGSAGGSRNGMFPLARGQSIAAFYQDPEQTTISAASIGGTDKCSLPGWQGRIPLYIPATKCSIQVMNMEELAKTASVANNLSRLRIYAICCPNPRAGIKKVVDFLEHQVLQEAANIPLSGGIAPLNMAALHGNFEAVQQLLSSGANINYRCKEDLHHTALHAAVIGGHYEIVRFLVSQGANQLIKDDSGSCPLHYACKLGNITITRMLMEAPGGKKAMLTTDNHDNKPIDVAANSFLKSCVEAVMRKLRIFVKPRVSLMERAN